MDHLPTTLTLLGTGTSQGVPVIGCSCEVCTSTNVQDKRLRTAALLSNQDTKVIIDCGPDIRQQLLRANVQDLDACIITHEHNDHIIGLDDLRPFIFKNKTPFKIYAELRVLNEIKKRFAYAFELNKYPGAPSFELITIKPEEKIKIGTLPTISTLRIMHGKLPILGFKIGKNLAYCTDTKTIPQKTLAQISGINTLILSALHHQTHHSHLNLNQAIAYTEIIEAKHSWFFHISHRMGLHTDTEQSLPENINLAFDQQIFHLEK